MNVRLYVWQRTTAAVAVHASIGVRNILSEWSPLKARAIDVFVILFGIALAILGFRAIAALVLA